MTELERNGLIAHGLDIVTPSQLSDVFRQGIAFALNNAPTIQREVPDHVKSIKIPTDTMEQEFQNYYRRGYEAGKKTVQREGWVSVPIETIDKE